MAASARVLREHALLAAQAICDLAVYSESERIRYQAATYIVDRVLDSQVDHDLRLSSAQARQVGHAVQLMVRTLGMKYGFDYESPEVRTLATEALVAASHETGSEGDAA
jgi:hypothetical protein